MDNNLLSALNRLRGIGVSSVKKTQEVSETPVAETVDLTKGNDENRKALSKFLQSESDLLPKDTQDKKYTMKDLDNFINSMVHHEEV